MSAIVKYDQMIYYFGKDITIWYQYAASIFQLPEKTGQKNIPQLIPFTISQFSIAAIRPPYKNLDCSEIISAFGIQILTLGGK